LGGVDCGGLWVRGGGGEASVSGMWYNLCVVLFSSTHNLLNLG
jgi:hypothetical protein